MAIANRLAQQSRASPPGWHAHYGAIAGCNGRGGALREMLMASPWGRTLTADDFAVACGGIVERRVVAGQFVCRKGDQVDYWYGVIDGLVKLSSDWISGKTATLGGVSAGGWFGEGSMLKNEPRRFDAVALRDSGIACMRRKTFDWLFENSLGFNRFLVHQLNERLGQIIGQLESERLTDIDARVARTLAGLFHLAFSPGDENYLAISQQELGDFAGVSRQRVNRSLQALKDAGIVALEYGGITVLDRDGLRRLGG